MAVAASDTACVLLALVSSYLIRFGTESTVAGYWYLVAAAPFIWIAVFKAHGLLTPHLLSPVEEARRITSAVSIGIVLIIMTSFWTYSAFSRIWVALSWLLALAFELVSRYRWRRRLTRDSEARNLSLRTLVIAPESGIGRIHNAVQAPRSGFTFVDDFKVEEPGKDPSWVSTMENLRAALRKKAIDCIFVDPAAVSDDQLADIAQIARQEEIQLKVAVSLPRVLMSRMTMQSIGGIPVVSMRPVRLRRSQAALKRTFDLVVGSILFVTSAPIAALAAVAVALTSEGPILFKQRRVTAGGETFTVYKFRTMTSSPLVQPPNENMSAAFFKLPIGDPRFTSVGRFLRRFSLDELPQFWNVLKGDMSLVGPRPLPAEQVEANPKALEVRHEMRAGMTGYWQINGRSDVDPEEALKMDLFYIENWSLTLDIYILLKTFAVVLSGRGAY